MKTKKLIVCGIFILSLLSACDKNKDEPDYDSVQIDFTLVDDSGNDLFFGENSPYDPYEVEIDTTRYNIKGWKIHDGCCFYIGGFYVAGSNLPNREIYIRFFPGRTDTITIEEYDNGQSSPSYDFNAFFNSDTICIKCDRGKTYKIKTETTTYNGTIIKVN